MRKFELTLSVAACVAVVTIIASCSNDSSTPIGGAALLAPALSAVAPPTITGLNPNPIPATSGFHTITLTGTNFVDQSAVVATWGINGGGEGPVAPSRVTYVSSTQLTVIAHVVGGVPDTGSFRVVNPEGTSSSPFPFTIVPPPTITGLSPSPIPATSGLHTITLTGTNFVDKPTVIATWGIFGGGEGPVDPSRVTYVSSTQLTVIANIVGGLPDTGSFRVVNPDGLSSSPFPFTIVPPPPTITGLGPALIPATSGPHTITLTGTRRCCS